ncbi:MAG: Gfo/Idh/MocA family oxidoreductase [Candidatus Nealsonbacteria bacterium]|nr:Gfo/Idh/MocA family oxidoreductase [Candidatus Nealsonbacteria bacterium]
MNKNSRETRRSRTLTRRKFLAAGTTSAAALTIVPSYVVRARGQAPPSEKLNIAGIGIGGMGRGNVNACRSENIVALCDVDKQYAAGTFKAYPDAAEYTDYRVMLDKQKDIDAVIIATPDHTHAVITLAAMQAGKHVFCQKPLTHTVVEARKITEYARANPKIMTQMGNQGHSSEQIRQVREWIQSGAIGDVKEVHAWTDRPIGNAPWSNFAVRELPTEFPPVPDTLNWDLWLGPAKQRKYHTAYVPLKWRGWLDYGTGSLGDMGCHILDPACWGLDLLHPSSITAEVEHVGPGLKDDVFPISAKVTFEFPKRIKQSHRKALAKIKEKHGEIPEKMLEASQLCAMKLVWHDGHFKVPRPSMLEEGKGLPASGAVIYGEKETILHSSHGAGGAKIIPEVRWKEFEQPDKTIPRVQGGHTGDWLRSCKDGQPASSNFADYGGQLTEMVLLGVAAQRVPGEKLQWDGKDLRFTNNDEANRYIHTPYRDGWSL